MIETSLYFLILFFLLIFFLKIKSNILGLWLLGSFLCVAFFSVLLCANGVFLGEEVHNIVFVPYVFLIIAYIIYSSPFLFSKETFNVSKAEPNLKFFYLFFSIAYIIASFIVIQSSFSIVLFLVEYGDWETAYRDDSLVRYSNAIEFYSIILTNHTRILAYVVGFLMLRMKTNIRMVAITALMLIISAAVTQIFCAVVSTSRSMIFEMLILLPAMYFFFYRDLTRKVRLSINILMLVVIAISLIFFIDVTISRFESRGTLDSVIFYFGQAPIVFNTQMFGLLDHYLFGEYTLGKLFGNDYINPVSFGGLWGTRFYTFVGWLYVDWGELGVVLWGTIIALFFFIFIKKEKYDTSDLFLLFSYYSFLLKGIFVIGRSYIIVVVSTLIIYLFLKYAVDFYSRKI